MSWTILWTSICTAAHRIRVSPATAMKMGSCCKEVLPSVGLYCHGHYARIEQLPNGRYAIRNSVTAAKDQTYALYNLTQEQLKRTLMPGR